MKLIRLGVTLGLAAMAALVAAGAAGAEPPALLKDRLPNARPELERLALYYPEPWLPERDPAAGLPPQAYLAPMDFVWQTMNNCGPASTLFALSYYDIHVKQADIRQALRPGDESRGMGPNVVPPYIAQWGMSTKININGTAGLVKRFIASGIPVIVSQWSDRPNVISHYRLVRGYDDTKGVFIANDSLLGENLRISYEDFEWLWQVSPSRYMPVYPKEREAEVKEILGNDYYEDRMWRKALTSYERKVAAEPNEPFLHNNLGQLYGRYNRWAEAADQYEAALKLPLPPALPANWRTRLGNSARDARARANSPLGF